MRHPADGTCAKRVVEMWPKVLEAIKVLDAAHGAKDGDDVMKLVNEFDRTIEELKRIA